mgnify:CR=1 FL=1
MKLNKNLKIYIAGHNGMVGNALVSHLRNKGYKKILVNTRKELNLLNQNKVFEFIKKKKPNVIINCAGRVGGILANSSFPVEFLNENILIQLNLINGAYANNISHLINLGSSCIYPKNSKQPIKENYLLTSKLEKTNEAYALAKIVGLKACNFYNEQYGTTYLTLMPCNMYGPKDNFDIKNSHFVPALIKKFIDSKHNNKKKVEIWGSGLPKREIMHVDDLASAITFILEKKLSNNKKLLRYIKSNSLINVGSGQEYTIKKFAEIIKKLTNTKKKLSFNRRYPDGTMRKVLDNKIMKNLGWKSKINLINGLRSTIEWYKSHY